MGHRAESARTLYRDELAALGRYFDQQLYRGIFIAEVDDGYVGKARPAEEDAEMQAEGFTFPHSDMQALMANAGTADGLAADGPPFCPGGYGLFMRAVGEMCDRVNAGYISVLEVIDGFVLGFNAPAKNGRGLERRRYHLDRVGIAELTNHVES